MDEWRRIYGACGSPAGVVGNCRFIVANVPSGFEFSGQTYVSSKAVAREPYKQEVVLVRGVKRRWLPEVGA